MSDNAAKDRVKDRLLLVVLSCLEHARTVRFGSGAAAYDTSDGDLRLTVRIEILSTVPKAEKP